MARPGAALEAESAANETGTAESTLATRAAGAGLGLRVASLAQARPATLRRFATSCARSKNLWNGIFKKFVVCHIMSQKKVFWQCHGAHDFLRGVLEQAVDDLGERK